MGTGTDNGSRQKRECPDDIKSLCKKSGGDIQEVQRPSGEQHKSADDEVTIKMAYRRNCLYMDNDNYRDWIQQIRDARIRKWLRSCQSLLHMRYYFDSLSGSFDLLEGNYPDHLLIPALVEKRPPVEKWKLWSLPRKCPRPN